MGMLNTTSFGLTASSGKTVSFKGVHIEGRLEGLHFSARLRQHYRNEGTEPLEVVYTFPLAHGATLLNLAVELGDKRLQGTVLDKPSASKRYEKAIDEGDSAVMVEQSLSGLCTANLGNLLPGESATLELEYAQLLRYEQGRIRLTIPTVIAERYGASHGPGRLNAHETTAVDALAEYPFTLHLTLKGAIARGKVASPTHRISSSLTPEGLDIHLDRGDMLDRDFVLNIENLQGQAYATCAAEGEQTVVLASFCPKITSTPGPVALKVLVDCSGSMAGDSINSARRALHAILQHLTPRDTYSYSCFGSAYSHHHRVMVPCTGEAVASFERLVASTDANLGGTEMESALRSTLEDITPAPEASSPSPSVLLITDGAVWAVDEIACLAQQSQQRLFVIGVGSAPGESLLQKLTTLSGGAYESVTPNDDMVAAILRMFHRMRNAQAVHCSVEWDVEPRWQSALPETLYDGETLHVFAQFDTAPAAAPRLTWTLGGQTQGNHAELLGQDTSDVLPRLCGAHRLALTTSKKAATALALQYQLISPYTALFLVHERAAGEKAQGLPRLQQVKQMRAAGHMGAGSVAHYELSNACVEPVACVAEMVAHSSTPKRSRSASRAVASQKPLLSVCQPQRPMKESASTGPSYLDIPAFLRGQATGNTGPVHAAKDDTRTVLQSFIQLAAGVRDLQEILQPLNLLIQSSNGWCQQALGALHALGLTADKVALAVLLDWLVQRYGDETLVGRQAPRLLREALVKVQATDLERARAQLENFQKKG